MHELGVGGGLVPAHARHREVGLALAVAAELPAQRPRPARLVTKTCHRLVEGEGLPLMSEGVLPKLGTAVAARVHELLELLVRHLVAVEPEVREVRGGSAPVLDRARGHQHHAQRRLTLGNQPQLGHPERRKGQLLRRVAGLGDEEAEIAPGQSHILEGRAAQAPPGRVGGAVGLQLRRGRPKAPRGTSSAPRGRPRASRTADRPRGEGASSPGARRRP